MLRARTKITRGVFLTMSEKVCPFQGSERPAALRDMVTHLVGTATEAHGASAGYLRFHGQVARVGNLSDRVIRGCLVAQVGGRSTVVAGAKCWDCRLRGCLPSRKPRAYLRHRSMRESSLNRIFATRRTRLFAMAKSYRAGSSCHSPSNCCAGVEF
jgi:hypothetical protein